MSMPLTLFEKIYQIFNPLNLIQTGWLTAEIAAVKIATVNFWLLKWEEGYIAFDCGFHCKEIVRELSVLQVKPAEITHIFLTHSDFDHRGGVALFSNAKCYLSCQEEQMINGKTSRKFGFLYNRSLKRPYILFKDGDMITVGKYNIEAIASPGHTPGSMSYLVSGRLLFIGDAFRIINQKAIPIGAIYTMDPQRHLASIKKLAALSGVEMVFTGHRGLSQDFKMLMAEYRSM